MSEEERTEQPESGEDWVKVGDAPPAEAMRDAAPPPDEEPRVYEGRRPTPPWKYSFYTGLTGLILMALVYIFPEVRRFETPWDPAFPTAFVLLVFPLFGIIWGLIGLIGKQFAGDRTKALAGVVLSILTAGVAYVVMVNDPAPEPATTQTDERLNMTPQELQEWRSEKLRQQ